MTIMDANNAYAFTANRPIKSPFKWNDYGYEIDGPVRIPHLFDGRNKLFFMSNFETLVQRQSRKPSTPCRRPPCSKATSAPGRRPSINPATGASRIPGNIIPASQLNPTSQALLKYYAVRHAAGLCEQLHPVQLRLRSTATAFIIRMDFVESAKSQWSGRYSWGSEVQKNGGLSITGTKVTTGYEQYLGSNTRILSPNIVNEARFGYTRFFNAISTAERIQRQHRGQRWAFPI